MALTMKTFGRLTALIGAQLGNFSDDTLEQIYDSCEAIAAPTVAIPVEQPKINLVSLFNAMIEGKKIDAVREHRSLTGMGLKESKDEVERLMHLMNASYTS